MVVQRTLTGYRKVHEEPDPDEDADDIELLQGQRTFGQGQHLDDVVENVRHEITLERRPPASGTDDQTALRNGRSFHRRYLGRYGFLTGWRVGVLAALIGTSVVCLFNIIMTAYIVSGGWGAPQGAFGLLYSGSCDKARSLNVWIHLIVNILSTLLLGASNYCMQVLCAPTRDELIRAHAIQLWLHIGIPSFRNLRFIARDRTYIWLALFLSSVPLHLLFNSVAITSLQGNEYMVIPATEDWLSGAAYNTSGFVDMDTNTSTKNAIVSSIDSFWLYSIPNEDAYFYGRDPHNRSNVPVFYSKIGADECFQAYKSQYISAVGNVYIIQSSPAVWRNLSMWWPQFHSNQSFTWNSTWDNRQLTADGDELTKNATFPFKSIPDFYQSNGWRCPSHTPKTCDTENPNEVPQSRLDWEPYEARIEYCLVERVQERCNVLFSVPIATLVIFSNIVKAVCMALTLHKYRRSTPLVTLGDAIAHFLDHPDPQTKGRCLFSRRHVETQWTWERCRGAKHDELGVEPEEYNPKRLLWQTAPSGRRWAVTYFSFFLAILLGIICTTRSLVGMPKDIKKLWDIGFGTISGNNLLEIDINLTGAIVIANVPQVLLSYLYLAFNALYTSMFIAREWSAYSHERKPLRVTSPIGQQRDTYWLHVPFRYAAPMLAISGLFHWLTSQSIFVVSIFVLEPYHRSVARQISTCGFSPIAIILATSLGAAIAIGGLIIGRFKFAGGMPVAASCSAAISAGCHPSPGDAHASTLPVQWGAVAHGKRTASNKDLLGHCTFSSLPVEEPIPGRLYA